MDQLPPCPECSCPYTYEMGALLVCSECSHEWVPPAEKGEGPSSETEVTITDAVGNVLIDGDTVTVIKNLKVKGSPTGIKSGTEIA